MVDKFRLMINEGDVYTISKFMVTKASATYKTSRNGLKILFLLTTSVDKFNGTDSYIPCYKFNFTDYNELTTRVNNNLHLSGKINPFNFI